MSKNISSRVFKGKIPLIICAILIAGLCFGQFIKPEIPPCHAELVSASKLVSQGIYVKPLSQWDNLTMLNLQTRTPQFFNTILMMQTEGDSLKPKTSFWKQAGIYGLEFVGAGIPASLLVPVATVFIVEGDVEYWHYDRWPILYAVSNSLLTSSCTWGVGKLLCQKGNWWKSAIGAGLGGIIGGYYLITGNPIKEGMWTWIIVIGLPTTGAVVGFNL